MPTLDFSGNALGPAVTIEAEAGRILDACDDARAPVSFSCRSASCGTCRVEVLEGEDRLEPPAADELEVLALFATSPRQRLACQAIARAGAGLIRLRWCDD